jgi:hypothetical protein
MNAPVRLRPSTELPFRFTVGEEVRLGDMRAVVSERLRSATGREIYNIEVQGEDFGRPHRTALGTALEPAARDVAMRAKVAVVLAEAMFKDLRAMESLLGQPLQERIGFDELTYQIYEIQQAASQLWPD